ncbi:MAG: beta-ketoacyl-[acyl-carrier-protein] synthase II [Spirochaetes bacterium GWF1_31_7]|nr:MAG: beta-ketoacyl-[acyl-carrier-protein] synthase II [Spirochaetes bacterium GWE1_32_154]OHD48811.1 MAG: beta-ketoacyl-[acyl-carrier-protein] synthase II [Spirochaetes bacterium GWE2_31_10]OHD52873.1 MAG: beta-ketoacyl-[acyl-carrier-protein] synthase II [Spirochaetes bacterium GWF1_31_7]HBD94673.1 beta-ketoacyl-[acyl-carrier-protein] synthase II [Spirochaetia bacterium]HBI37508.1 beta-ketoacyl-[acyl-carrier-protein] synthase II [Spirochaetia bacterium]
MSRRVVITGIGTINPLANNVEDTWKKMLDGVSGIDTIKSFNTDDYRCKVGGELKDFTPANYHIDTKIANKMDRSQQIAFACTVEATKMAGIQMTHPEDHSVILPGFENMKPVVSDPFRMGVMFGIGVGGILSFQEQLRVLDTKGARRVSPFIIPKMIVNLAGGWVAQSTNAKGINTSYVTACASSTNALGEAFLAIKNNRADVIISGGFESGICEISFAGFGNMHALSSKRNEEPQKASRPFDKDRDGFVMGDGGATIILEEYEHAKKRGATILAEFVGYGLTEDAHHMTSPDPEGSGAIRAINDALAIAEIKPDSIDYINAHGTSTGANDSMETNAIKKAFGTSAHKLSVSSTKSMTGHLLGGAGAVEAMVCIKACMDDKVPPTINLDNPDEGFDLDYVAHTMKSRSVNYAMSNSFGFGGHNAVIILKKYK